MLNFYEHFLLSLHVYFRHLLWLLHCCEAAADGSARAELAIEPQGAAAPMFPFEEEEQERDWSDYGAVLRPGEFRLLQGEPDADSLQDCQLLRPFAIMEEARS